MPRPEFMKTRITLDQEIWDPEQENKSKRWMFNFAKSMVEVVKPYIYTKCSAGFEFKSKTGDWCKPHLHIHFDTITPRDSIVKQLRRVWKEQMDEPFKVKTVWTMKEEHYLNDEVKFFRYAWKQYESLEALKKHDLVQHGYSDAQIEEHRAVAHQVWLESREYARAKADKYEDDTGTIYDRCCKVLDEINPLTIRDINGVILDVYIKEKKPINLRTIDGYTLCYALTNGIVDKERVMDRAEQRLGI